jgi:hypothetical protein
MDPETGRISPIWEFVAGGTAGGCQVVSQPDWFFPWENSSRCCAGFHEPTGNCVRCNLIGSVCAMCSHEEYTANTGRSDYKCRVKQPKQRVLYHEVHSISCANLDFWVYTVAHRRVCCVTSHSQRYTSRHTLT